MMVLVCTTTQGSDERPKHERIWWPRDVAEDEKDVDTNDAL